MTTYIIRRLIQFAIIMFGLSVVFFLILHLTPGGPCALEGSGDPKARARQIICAHRLGLDKPLPVQYLLWIGGYFRGDFGTSQNGVPVTALMLDALPTTVLLATVSYAIQQMIALPLGVFSALKQYSFFDTVFTVISYIGLSMPTFFLGLVLLFGLTVHFHLFPAGRVVADSGPPFWTPKWFTEFAHDPIHTTADLGYHLILPAFTLMFVGIATDSRFMRASMLDVIHQDYIRTATAKGLRRKTVIFKHAFRNAVLPIITNIALYLPALVGGFIITESIFTYTGLGYMFFNALNTSDYQLLQGFLMITAMAVLLANLLADLTYAWVDPRIRYD